MSTILFFGFCLLMGLLEIDRICKLARTNAIYIFTLVFRFGLVLRTDLLT
jgi:hypothetical protein